MDGFVFAAQGENVKIPFNGNPEVPNATDPADDGAEIFVIQREQEIAAEESGQ
jgi:hypothetical protein